MSKLPKEHKFLDFSDYGRAVAILIANSIKNTSLTPIHVTVSFIIAGLGAIYCILEGYNWIAAGLLILKSILDAADGELARIKNTPSYTGRYFDSISDYLLNAGFILSFWYVTNINIGFAILAFVGIQLQGTLYNYYYVILRNCLDGDKTSRVFENEVPIALKGERQKNVNFLFKIYKLLYGVYDRVIYLLDKEAPKKGPFPKWFMSIVSLLGLGFQLFIMSLMLVLNLKEFIIPFFLYYTVLILLLISLRRML